MARFVAYQEASVHYDHINNDITIGENFTAEWVVDLQMSLLNDSAKENMKLYQLLYSQDSESIKILSANTITNNVDQSVNIASIEDKSVASDAAGFVDDRQILIPFKDIQVGSQVSLKYLRMLKKPVANNHFSTLLHYGVNGYWKESITKISSKVPLYIYANDPFKVLKVESYQSSGDYSYTIELLKHFTSQTVNEPSWSYLDHSLETWISISTDDS